MLGGDDELIVLGTDDSSELDGGAGRNLLDLGAGADTVTADLEAGTATVTYKGVTEIYSFVRFEDTRAQAYGPVNVTGTDGSNLIQVYGCNVEVTAGAGEDVVRWRELSALGVVGKLPDFRATSLSAATCGDPGIESRFNGEEGDDRLYSGSGDDDLTGGAGNDTADGNRGQDHCEAETVTDCES